MAIIILHSHRIACTDSIDRFDIILLQVHQYGSSEYEPSSGEEQAYAHELLEDHTVYKAR